MSCCCWIGGRCAGCKFFLLILILILILILRTVTLTESRPTELETVHGSTESRPTELETGPRLDGVSPYRIGNGPRLDGVSPTQLETAHGSTESRPTELETVYGSTESRPTELETADGSRPTGFRPGVLGLLVEKIPFLVLSILACGMTLKAAGRMVEPLAQYPFLPRAVNALLTYFRYVEKMVWPADLVAVYPLEFGWSSAEVLTAGLFFIVVSVTSIRLWKARPLAGRLAVVFGHPGSRDRPGASGGAADGGSLHLSPCHRHFHDCLLGSLGHCQRLAAGARGPRHNGGSGSRRLPDVEQQTA